MDNVPIAVRRLQFAAGHRVYGHESKCANLHGHNYVVFIHARQKQGGLDSIGRVIDFGVLKERYGFWIDSFWDHGTLLYTKDPLRSLFVSHELLLGQKRFDCPFNPTAEEMAKHLLNIGPELFRDTDVEVFKIVLWETENCRAEVSL